MNQETFDRIVEDRCRLIKNILASKAKEYARGDRLHNFKRAAGFLGKTPETACWGFAMKHITSIADLVDDIELHGSIPSSEVVHEKLGDAINYLILLEALVWERLAEDGEIDGWKADASGRVRPVYKNKQRRSK